MCQCITDNYGMDCDSEEYFGEFGSIVSDEYELLIEQLHPATQALLYRSWCE